MHKKLSVHRTLAYSYTAHSIFFLIGVFLDTYWHQSFTREPYASFFGFMFLFLATWLVFWAQYTSRITKVIRSKIHLHTPHMFAQGPYKIFRSPTNLGLMFLVFGFGFLMNSVIIVLMSLVAYIFCQSTFVRMQQKMLTEKYGEQYEDYTKNVQL